MDELLKFLKWLFLVLVPDGKINTASEIILTLVFLIIALVGVFAITAQIIEKLLSQFEKLRAHGLPFARSEAEKKEIQRRTLFAQVVKGDLDTLARKENWNDLAFSELDAEVEFEGKYYPSNTAKFYKQSLRGFRKVASLSQAINESANSHLLLLGEPGSGKSVALRHFAIQMAEKAQKSNASDVLIPLYVNLREFERGNYADLSPTSIKAFILDNVRRDSPSTTEYIELHWDKYCERGLWFFLFDSFDELPELLHSAESDQLKHEYSEAIRVFLGKTGPCQAIVASREFRSPDTLNWDKLRILQLSFARKLELVGRSLISEEAKIKIRRFLASYEGNLYSNPLFLTLLCRYVAEHGSTPNTDYSLLDDHVVTLLRRDHSYIARTFRLSSEDALKGSVRLAALYATNASLGLAPTRDEIENAVQDEFLKNRLDEILGALVACKVLRRDFKEAKTGDLRYAFSHRRYQETMFVRYILAHQEDLSPTKVVRTRKWREYIVALIQGQPDAKLKPYLDVLKVELEHAISEFPSKTYEFRNICTVKYSSWKHAKMTYYLSIFLDAYRGKYDRVPAEHRQLIEAFLTERNASSDMADEFMAVRYSVLCTEVVAMKWIKHAVSAPSVYLQNEAFSKASAIREPDELFAKYVRKRYSTQVLLSRDKSEILRTEALLSHFSKKMGCDYVYARAVVLRNCFGWFIKLCASIQAATEGKSKVLSRALRICLSDGIEAIPFLLFWLLLLLWGTARTLTWHTESNFLSLGFFSVVLGLLILVFLLMYFARDEPRNIDPKCVLNRGVSWLRHIRDSDTTKAIMGIWILVSLPCVIIHFAARALGYSGSAIFLYLLTSMFLFFSLVAAVFWNDRREHRLRQKTLRSMLAQRDGSPLWILLQSNNWIQLLNWTLELDRAGKLRNHSFRRLFALMGAFQRNEISPKLPVFLNADSNAVLSMIKFPLLDLYFVERDSRDRIKGKVINRDE